MEMAMNFTEALSKYSSTQSKRFYTNRTSAPLVVTVEAIQTKTGETFSFGKERADFKCDFFQLQSASFLVAPNEFIIGDPSEGAEVWINVTVQQA
jgi:hypothetical protein